MISVIFRLSPKIQAAKTQALGIFLVGTELNKSKDFGTWYHFNKIWTDD